jgi:heparan-alpha-glucosaminide N-acetyltransferase
MKQLPNRLLSIDVFRAITMLLMIFVNDVSGVANIPAWIEHVSGKDDGLGFADTIFPTFLFIVGLSLPFAIKNKMKKGESVVEIGSYILLRSAALIIMGFFHVNLSDYNGDAAIISRDWWEILITVSFFLIWLDYPETMQKTKKYAFTGVGIVLLILMAYIYKGGTGDEIHGMRPSWWGILGIIGWAYLLCALVFLLLRGNLAGLIAAFGVLIGFNILCNTDTVNFRLPLIGNASHAALIMAGAVISSLYSELITRGKDKLFWYVFAGLGVLILVAGHLIRPFADGISKIRSTPAWVLISIGTAILFFEFFIYLIDIKGKQNWFKAIRPAGTSTLTCYLIPYLAYSVMGLLNTPFPEFLSTGGWGIFRSFAFAFAVILIVGLMEKRRIRLKI